VLSLVIANADRPASDTGFKCFDAKAFLPLFDLVSKQFYARFDLIPKQLTQSDQ
jgi:hypothetical protein